MHTANVPIPRREVFDMLKKIEAIIREERFSEVKEALCSIGIMGMNVSEIRGQGRQGGIELVGRSGTYKVDMLPKIQINIILSERNLQVTVDTIMTAARTGESGDGLICSAQLRCPRFSFGIG